MRLAGARSTASELLFAAAAMGERDMDRSVFRCNRLIRIVVACALGMVACAAWTQVLGSTLIDPTQSGTGVATGAVQIDRTSSAPAPTPTAGKRSPGERSAKQHRAGNASARGRVIRKRSHCTSAAAPAYGMA